MIPYAIERELWPVVRADQVNTAALMGVENSTQLFAVTMLPTINIEAARRKAEIAVEIPTEVNARRHHAGISQRLPAVCAKRHQRKPIRLLPAKHRLSSYSN